VISYAAEDASGKPKEASVFVTEVSQFGGIKPQHVTLSENDILKYYENIFTQREVLVPMIDRSLVSQALEKFELSVTSLNKYLECPRAFYFENILRVPAAKASHMGFGSAIHYALEQFFDFRFRKGKDNFDKHSLIQSFEKGMERNRAHFSLKEYKDRMDYGKKILTGYYEKYALSWKQNVQLELELPIRNVEYKGIPIKGVLDKVVITGERVQVVDYKTGKYENSTKKLNTPSTKNPVGGNYWRQIVFYKMLTIADQKFKWTMDEGVIDFIQPKKDGSYVQRGFQVNQDDLNLVSEQMKEVYQKILNYEFQDGCEECQWCKLVRNHFAIDGVEAIPHIEEE
jgi:DNA helicase-2/ATP-dependent DNA helicase PcrA